MNNNGSAVVYATEKGGSVKSFLVDSDKDGLFQEYIWKIHNGIPVAFDRANKGTITAGQLAVGMTKEDRSRYRVVRKNPKALDFTRDNIEIQAFGEEKPKKKVSKKSAPKSTPRQDDALQNSKTNIVYKNSEIHIIGPLSEIAEVINKISS